MLHFSAHCAHNFMCKLLNDKSKVRGAENDDVGETVI